MLGGIRDRVSASGGPLDGRRTCGIMCIGGDSTFHRARQCSGMAGITLAGAFRLRSRHFLARPRRGVCVLLPAKSTHFEHQKGPSIIKDIVRTTGIDIPSIGLAIIGTATEDTDDELKKDTGEKFMHPTNMDDLLASLLLSARCSLRVATLRSRLYQTFS